MDYPVVHVAWRDAREPGGTHRMNVWQGEFPFRGDRKVMRGGSYLCHDNYCFRYRVDARSSDTPDSSGGNIGFRCVAETG